MTRADNYTIVQRCKNTVNLANKVSVPMASKGAGEKFEYQQNSALGGGAILTVKKVEEKKIVRTLSHLLAI